MWRKTIAMVSFSLTLLGGMSTGFSYEVQKVTNGATIAGRVAFSGTVPAPRTFEVKKGPEVCGEERSLAKVEVQNGFLKGAVVVLEGIAKGKPFEAQQFKGDSPNEGEFQHRGGDTLDLNVRLKNCNFGPFTGVVTPNQPIQFLNQDPIKHTLHTYVLKGKKATILKTVHNQQIPPQAEISKAFESKKLKHAHVVAMTCDRHDFMENWMYVVESPYFAISDPSGTFTIAEVPPGEYELVAWHPVLGIQKQAVSVTPHGTIQANFQFSK